MPKITLLRGLPGSGKSTVAKDLLVKDGNAVIINRDALREMLFGPMAWNGKQERIVEIMENMIVDHALEKDKNVIIDNTHLRHGVEKWKQFTRDNEYKFEIVDLTEKVPLVECIRRDAQRTGKACVGRGVIERMALETGLIDLSVYDKIAIVDIDGTLANMEHRVAYLQEKPKNYHGFYGTVHLDAPHHPIINAVKDLYNSGHCIILLSGRPTMVIEDHINVGWLTNVWLKHNNVPFHHLFMRRGGDYRQDDAVKKELFEMMVKKIKLRPETIKVVFDDRERVCKVWRSLRLPLIKVFNGSYVEDNICPMMAEKLGIPFTDEKPIDF